MTTVGEAPCGATRSASWVRDSRMPPGPGARTPGLRPFVSAGTGPARFPRPLLQSPHGASPSAELPGASPNFPGRRQSPHPSRPRLPPAEVLSCRSSGRVGRGLLPRPVGVLRRHARPCAPDRAARSRTAPYVGDVRGDAAPWGISQRHPPPFRRGREQSPRHPSPARTPQPRAAEAGGSQWAPRRWAGWRLPPSRGRARGVGERASHRLPGRGGGAAGGGGGGAGEQPPEDHCSPRLRSTHAGPAPPPPA